MYPQCRRSAPPGAYIIYPEAQNRGKAAAASSASTWDSGNGSSSSSASWRKPRLPPRLVRAQHYSLSERTGCITAGSS
nr:unnamed protein product [Leishmania braziliensis]CAJ2478270.1 unnamed protein product [Leishmania braziliensis]